jgi:hypothetical protein
MWQWLDVAPADHSFRRSAIHLLVKIASRSGQLPPSLFIENVIRDTSWRNTGGSGDVFCGTYMGNKVAVKQLRLLSGDTQSAQAVIFTLFYSNFTVS